MRIRSLVSWLGSTFNARPGQEIEVDDAIAAARIAAGLAEPAGGGGGSAPVLVEAGGALTKDANGILKLDTRVPAAAGGSLQMSEPFVSARTGDSWTLQQISDRLAVSLAGTFAPAGSSTGGSSTPAPAPAYAITVNTPASQVAGTAFTISGTYANGTPAALQISKNGGAFADVAATISGGTFSLSTTFSGATSSATVAVRDKANTAVSATTSAFTVAAASGGMAGAGGGGTTPPPAATSAYTFAAVSKGSASQAAGSGTSITLTCVKTADGTTADAVNYSTGTSTTTPPPSYVAMYNSGNMDGKTLFGGDPYFMDPGTYYYWAKGPDGVAVLLSDFPPVVVS